MVIGITGSFGSGKSTVSKMFARLGSYVIDADKVCHSLMTPSNKVYGKIVSHFGRSFLKKDKTIDRKKLSEIVFKERAKLDMLNKLVHPEAIKKISKIIRTERKRKVIVIDAALLVESNFYKKVDKLVVVKTSNKIQIDRMIEGEGVSRKEILERIRMQAPLKKKLALADFIIDNSGSRGQTNVQVEKIWTHLRRADYAGKSEVRH